MTASRKPQKLKFQYNEKSIESSNSLYTVDRATTTTMSSSKVNKESSAHGNLAGSIMRYVTLSAGIPDSHRCSEIASFYDGRSIFITGASGFIGKCLTEKLLRSCPNIKKIYILMRPKRGLDVCERFEALVRSELFDRLKSLPDGEKQLSKIKVVKGDITKPYFGLSDRDIETLSSEVSLVFHSAATVKFVEPLENGVENNVISVHNLIDLASKLHQLEAMVHVSTAYSNCDRQEVDEIFYEPPFEAEKLIQLAQCMKSDLLEEITPKLLGKRPNTYTLTKAVAESLLAERTKKLLPEIPIAMIRPSIVGGAWKQPIPGWVDNFNGPTGVILALMTGGIRAMFAYPDYCADIVPVDAVANLIICAAKEVHDKRYKLDLKPISKHSDGVQRNIEIYNCTSGSLNPVLWSDFSHIIRDIGAKYPCNTLIREPGTWLISNEYFYNIYDAVFHASTAHIMDWLLRLFGQKPKLVILYKRLVKMVQTLKPFTTSQWLFKCSNVTSLYERMNPIDREIFNFDIRQIDWEDYIQRYYIGSKIFALKDDPKDIIKARRKLNMMRGANRTFQLMFLAIMYYVLISGTSIESTIIEFMYQAIQNVSRFRDASWSMYYSVKMET